LHQRRGRVVAELTELLGEVPVVLPPICRLDPTEWTSSLRSVGTVALQTRKMSCEPQGFHEPVPGS